MPVASRLTAVTIDCPEPRKRAAFYQALTGWEKPYDEDEYAAVAPAGDAHPGLYFQRVEPYTAPVWPDQGHPQQFHLDFYAEGDLDTAEAAALVLGARRAEH